MNTIPSILAAKLLALFAEEEGQDLVEYALLIALISLGAVAGLTTLGSTIASVFTNVNGTLSSAL